LHSPDRPRSKLCPWRECGPFVRVKTRERVHLPFARLPPGPRSGVRRVFRVPPVRRTLA
jgi:hypothetical protein